MRYIVLYHIGLGDHIVMSGYIHYLLEDNNVEEVLLLVKNNYSKYTLEHLYSGYPKVSLYFFDNDSDNLFSRVNKKPKNTFISYKDNNYIIKNFGCHSESSNIYLHGLSWADSFYVSENISPIVRYEYFKLPKSMNSSKKMYLKLIHILKTENYILLHDDPSRKRSLNYSVVKDIVNKNNHSNLPIVYLGINRYNYPLLDNPDYSIEEIKSCISCESILDLYHIISNAKECHFMDSSLACLTDQIKDSNSILYNHSYASHATISRENITLINRNWIHL